MKNSYSLCCTKTTCCERNIEQTKIHAPQSILRSVYFSLAHLYLYYRVKFSGNAALIYTHKTQVQLHNVVKIITRTSFFKTRLSHLYI